MHALLNISRSKDSQTLKFCQLMEYNKRSASLHKYAEIEKGRVVPDLLFFKKKALYEIIESSLQLSFKIF